MPNVNISFTLDKKEVSKLKYSANPTYLLEEPLGAVNILSFFADYDWKVDDHIVHDYNKVTLVISDPFSDSYENTVVAYIKDSIYNTLGDEICFIDTNNLQKITKHKDGTVTATFKFSFN